MWGSKILGNYASGAAGKAIAGAGGSAYKAGSWMASIGSINRATIHGGLGGAALGGAYGAVSDDTSVLGGMLIGAGIGAGVGRYGAASLKSSGTRRAWNNAAGAAVGKDYKAAASGLADTGIQAGRGAGRQVRADIDNVMNADYKGMYDKGASHFESAFVSGKESAKNLGARLRGNKAAAGSEIKSSLKNVDARARRRYPGPRNRFQTKPGRSTLQAAKDLNAKMGRSVPASQQVSRQSFLREGKRGNVNYNVRDSINNNMSQHRKTLNAARGIGY